MGDHFLLAIGPEEYQVTFLQIALADAFAVLVLRCGSAGHANIIQGGEKGFGKCRTIDTRLIIAAIAVFGPVPVLDKIEQLSICDGFHGNIQEDGIFEGHRGNTFHIGGRCDQGGVTTLGACAMEILAVDGNILNESGSMGAFCIRRR